MRKNLLSLAALAAFMLPMAAAQAADEWARVVSSTPVVQQVAVPRQVCSTEPVLTQPQKSGAGAAMGAIAGGAMGNAIGNGGGRMLATVIGAFGGAILGNHIEGAPSGQVQQVQQCSTQTFYENRPVAWNVVYEYAGKQYSVQMPSDPGPQLRLQILPVGGVPLPPPTAATSPVWTPSPAPSALPPSEPPPVVTAPQV